MNKTKILQFYSFALLGASLIFFNNCKEDDVNNNNYLFQVPVLTTVSISNIEPTTAKSGGNITYGGGATISTRGVCWSTVDPPTILNNKTVDGAGTGSFTSNISELSPNVTYFVRAYATNSRGTGYGNTLVFTTLNNIDIDGNIYNTVTIGTQTWMAENLKTTKYSDGTAIPNVTDNTTWINLTTGAYCDYNNNPSISANYGRLYNGYAFSAGNLCPTGWHVPTDAEWKTLEMALGMSQYEADLEWWRGTDEGTKLKVNGSSGFNAHLAGLRDINSNYFDIGDLGYYWTSTEGLLTTKAYRRAFSSTEARVYRGEMNKVNGFSVRCIKN